MTTAPPAHGRLKQLVIALAALVMLGGYALAWYGIDSGLLIVATAISLVGFALLALMISHVYHPRPTHSVPAGAKSP